MLDLNRDPIIYKTACGGSLKDPASYPSSMFRGERVYFCAKTCLKAFLKAPDAFMAGEIEHPLDDEFDGSSNVFSVE